MIWKKSKADKAVDALIASQSVAQERRKAWIKSKAESLFSSWIGYDSPSTVETVQARRSS